MRSIFAGLLLMSSLAYAADFSWAPSAPGKATIGSGVALSNRVLSLDAAAAGLRLTNRWTNETINPIVQLDLGFAKHEIQKPPEWKKARRITLPANPKSARAADRLPGVGLEVMQTVDGLKANWRAALRDGCSYARVELSLTAIKADVDVREVRLLGMPNAEVVGKTPGSPMVSRDFFAGLEHPMALSVSSNGLLISAIQRKLSIRKGTTVTYSAVIGVAPKGQMRRAFLAYVENERAHPYRPFLHYNSWYDIGYFTPYNEADCLDRINKFGEQLVRKRGVKMDSFLFDDGWDNYESVWEFHKGFPRGFLPLRDEAKKFGAGPGVWLSPWGGYGKPRETRLAYGKAHGMEVDRQGYALSGPKYYKRFHEVTTDFVTRQGINHFKLDGTGSPDKSTPGSQFDSDFDAAIALVGDLRRASPELFINLTTGTWPSPFWLRTADSIWRGGSDHSFAGLGTWRQQWITYRDSDTYHGIVLRGPLFPLNSLMLHGIIYAKNAQHLGDDPGNDFRDEVRDYFATGTQLQEMYITPDLLTKQNWDDLAEAAKWSRANADVLRDTHWVGGDPSKLDVYGWASWSARKGILVLRNPSDKPQAFSVDIASVLELPPKAAEAFVGRSPYKDQVQSLTFPVGDSLVVDLKPFEVLVLDLEAAK